MFSEQGEAEKVQNKLDELRRQTKSASLRERLARISDTLASSQEEVLGPPPTPGDKGAREYSLEVERWLQKRRQQRLDQYGRKEDNEIADLAKLYAIVAIAIFVVAATTTLPHPH